MRDLFFYGTLRCRPLLEIVLGRPCAELDISDASLPGHAVKWVQGAPYPMIVPEAGARADGLLVRGLSQTDLDRLIYYEGGFDYGLSPVTVTLDRGDETRAEVFFPPDPDTAPGRLRPGAPWSLDDWQAMWGETTLRAADEVMAYFGRMDAGQIAKRFPSVRRRAWSWVAARTRPGDGVRDLGRDIQVHSYRRAFLNFFGMDEVVLSHRRHDGTMSPPVERAGLMVGDAVVVLPYDPRTDQVLLVEQFRAPVFMAGDPAPWVWEPVAGLVDPGETPPETAHREAWEEAGVRLDRLEPVARAYSSTGSSGEFLHLFVGIADLRAERGAGGGVDHEGEDILPRVFSYDDLMAGVDRQDFRDMPLLTTALWLARHRDRLRKTA